MLMLLTNALTRTIFHILQGVRRRAVRPHRGERVLHGEGREHANPTSPGRCELPAQDGHRPPRPEGTAAHTLTHSHTHTLSPLPHFQSTRLPLSHLTANDLLQQ